MPDIKTRDALKSTIKAINKAAVAGERVKESYARIRDRTAHGTYSAEGSTEEYAADRFLEEAEAVAFETVHQLDKQGRKGAKTTKENISKARELLSQRRADLPKRQAREKAADAVRRQAAEPARQSMKTADREVMDCGSRGIKRRGKATGKAGGKPAGRSPKPAGQAAGNIIKTGQDTGKAVQETAQAVEKAFPRAMQMTIAVVRKTVAAARALVAAVAAGWWAAAVIVTVICLIGLLLGSNFGIFFSGEDRGTGQTMPDAVREINTEYQDKLDTIRQSNSHDVLEVSGSRAVWKEVLAIYAVKTTTDPDGAQEVVSMDDARKAILKDIFWQMNEISYRMETRTGTVITETDDGNGNIVETTTTVTRTTLYITASHKTAEAMADYLHFTADQRAQLAELLAEENDSLWASVLYGVGTTDEQIVAVALSQIGNIGGEPYWSWYGFGSHVDWCACFVSWCANECGYIENGVIPTFASCVNGVRWFKERGQWADGGAEPTPGMIIFFDWADVNGGRDGKSDHVGIVEKCENGIVYTVEGNSGDSCRQRQYSVGYYEILGYGVPNY